MKKFIDDFPIIAIKGFIGCLGIMGIFELADVDILGYILHKYIWK